MPVAQELIENGRILLVTFTDPWAAKEMLQLFPESRKYYDAAERPLHLLIDVSGARLSMPGALRAREAPASNIRWAGRSQWWARNRLCA